MTIDPSHATTVIPPVLDIRQISKRFPGVNALLTVDLTLLPGEVHAIVGENGAGKSTLINLCAGVMQPDEGEVHLDGQTITIDNPVEARRLGIVTVFQESELFGPLSVAENMALGQGLPIDSFGLVRWRSVRQSATSALAALGEGIDVDQPAEQLSIAQRHMTQLAAAVTLNARVVILDEPTSALSEVESEWLFSQIQRLRSQGVAIAYISHRQDEIFRLADRITVLRDGRRVWHGLTTETNRAQLVAAMVGRAESMGLQTQSPRARVSRSPVPRLRVHGLTSVDGSFACVDLQCHAGEIVGIYGLIGAGRSEFAQALFGLGAVESGTIAIDGQTLSISNPMQGVVAGIAYLPEDRLRQGVCRGLSVRSNSVISSLNRWSIGILVNPIAERRASIEATRRFDVRFRSVEQTIGQLSGGNQQKVVLARWMLTQPRVLLLDEPTRGVDVAAKLELHRLIRQLADEGCAVLLISSELPEILKHSDRIVVFRQGRISAVIDASDVTPATVAEAALPLEEVMSSTSAGKQGFAKGTQPRRLTRLRWTTELGLILTIFVLGSALTFSSGGQFLRPDSLVGVLESAAVRTILALGTAAVIIAGGIDISIGSLLALAAAVSGLTMSGLGGTGFAVVTGIGAGLAVGAAGGMINAVVSLIGRIHPIVVTLGTMTIYRGLMITMTGGNVIADLPVSFTRLATSKAAGVSGSVLLLVISILAAHVFFSRFRSGRHLFALGSSESAARLAGISRNKVWLLAFGIGGFAAAVAGLLELALNGSMQSVLGTGYELRAIAAAVIGGTAITGGRGSAVGVALGALLLTLVEKSLVLWSISQYRNDLVIGALLTTAILLDRILRRGSS